MPLPKTLRETYQRRTLNTMPKNKLVQPNLQQITRNIYNCQRHFLHFLCRKIEAHDPILLLDSVFAPIYNVVSQCGKNFVPRGDEF